MTLRRIWVGGVAAWGIAVLFGCGSAASVRSDAAGAVDSDERHDAPSPPARWCGAGFSQFALPATVGLASELATDGTTLYVVSTAADGSSQLQAMPITGGTLETIAMVASGGFPLTSFGDAVFYGAELGSGAYELHQRVGSVDTVLGSVSSNISIALEANATDLYVMGSDTASQLGLWRLSRAGGTGSTPPKVTSVATSYSGNPGFALGTTIAAWQEGVGAELVMIPGPAAATSIAMIGGNVMLSGDRGFAVDARLVTSRTTILTISEFTPTNSAVYHGSVYLAQYTSFLSDSSHMFFSVQPYRFDNSEGNPSRPGLFDALAGGAELCNFDPSPRFQDATNIYGLEKTPQGWVLNVVPKPL